MQMFKENAETADANWHKLKRPDEDLFIELRTQKLANICLIQCLDSIKYRIEELEAEIKEAQEE